MAKHDVTGNGKRDFDPSKTGKPRDDDGKHSQGGGKGGSSGGKK